MRIPGKRRRGYVLDFHTVRSEFTGHDEFGRPMFDTERTELGELVYRLKYGSDRSVLQKIVATAVRFLRSWNPPIEAVVPTPPSRRRRYQPLLEIGKALSARIELPLRSRLLVKVKDTPELKSIHDYHERLRLLEDAYTVRASVVKGKNVLLIDDLYRSGATLNAITEVLHSEAGVANVYALALTRTRSKI